MRTIKHGLKANSITGDRSQEIAKKILEMIPENTTDQLLTKIIPQIGREITELGSVVHHILVEQDVERREKALLEVREMLKKFIAEEASRTTTVSPV